jgi:hypothetical protein
MTLKEHIVRLRKIYKAVESEKQALIEEKHATNLHVPINDLELDLYELIKQLEYEEGKPK